MSAGSGLEALATIVIPTIGRESLGVLLRSLSGFDGDVYVVDDRPNRGPLALQGNVPRLTVLLGRARGPAHARNVGWRHARTPWVVFLDDDVEPASDWLADLESDLAVAQTVSVERGRVDGVQGRIRVPHGPGPQSDGEWTTRSLENARWITADMAYRREALARCGGFDERFTRAFREDADLAIRVRAAGGTLMEGRRMSLHPSRREPWWACLGHQRGNADDMLMRRLHGPEWRRAASASRGLRRYHLATSLALGTLVTAGSFRRRRLAMSSGAVGAALIGAIAARRIQDSGVRGGEIAKVAATTPLLPILATAWTAWGAVKHWRALPWRGLPDLVLFDRDGTLIRDVPYNGDSRLVQPIPGCLEALQALRDEGIRLGVVTNQSGVGRGLITRQQVQTVNDRVSQLLGPFDVVTVCPHGPSSRCQCRKPSPGQVRTAARCTGTLTSRCVVIGDALTDVSAAISAGASSILVPSPATSSCDIVHAPVVEPTMVRAVERILNGNW